MPHESSNAVQAPSRTLQSEWIDCPDGIASISAAWQAMTTTGAHASPFFQQEWVSATLKSLLAGAPPALLTTRGSDSLTSILPLVRSRYLSRRIPLRTLRGITSAHSCRMDLICGQAPRESILERTWQALTEDPWWQALVVDDVLEDGAFHGIMKRAAEDGYLTTTWRTRLSPYLTFAQSEDPFALCPKRYKSFRNRLKGKLGKLRERGCVEFLVEDSPPDASIQAFFALEASGWKGAQGSAILAKQAVLDFYTAVTAAARRSGYLLLYSLQLDGKPIAMHLGFARDGTYCTPKVAYDERFREFNVGHVLMQHVIRDITGRGIKRFEFLGPNALWKSVWSTMLQRHDTCYIFRPTLQGRTAHFAVAQLGLRARAIRHRMYGDPQILP